LSQAYHAYGIQGFLHSSFPPPLFRYIALRTSFPFIEFLGHPRCGYIFFSSVDLALLACRQLFHGFLPCCTVNLFCRGCIFLLLIDVLRSLSAFFTDRFFLLSRCLSYSSQGSTVPATPAFPSPGMVTSFASFIRFRRTTPPPRFPPISCFVIPALRKLMKCCPAFSLRTSLRLRFWLPLRRVSQTYQPHVVFRISSSVAIDNAHPAPPPPSCPPVSLCSFLGEAFSHSARFFLAFPTGSKLLLFCCVHGPFFFFWKWKARSRVLPAFFFQSAFYFGPAAQARLICFFADHPLSRTPSPSPRAFSFSLSLVN